MWSPDNSVNVRVTSSGVEFKLTELPAGISLGTIRNDIGLDMTMDTGDMFKHTSPQSTIKIASIGSGTVNTTSFETDFHYAKINRDALSAMNIPS
jgi:hypothetical protein